MVTVGLLVEVVGLVRELGFSQLAVDLLTCSKKTTVEELDVTVAVLRCHKFWLYGMRAYWNTARY